MKTDINLIEKFKLLEKESNAIMDDKKAEPNWSKRFNKSYDHKKPIADWAYQQFIEVCNKIGLTTNDEKFKRAYKDDHKCGATFDLARKNSWSEEQRQEESRKICVLHEDDDIYVSAFLDYDCDTTLYKYHVKHKPSGFSAGGAYNLGTKYLNTGISISI